jgi:hypothetical protein
MRIFLGPVDFVFCSLYRYSQRPSADTMQQRSIIERTLRYLVRSFNCNMGSNAENDALPSMAAEETDSRKTFEAERKALLNG